MAFSIGTALSRQLTVRPVLVRVIRPASDNTSRCFMTAGSDIENGRANSLTEKLERSQRRAMSARLVASESAAKVRSSVAG